MADSSNAFAIRFHETGGPEVLTVEPIHVGDPGPGEVRIRHKAVGLNFIDTYFRTGLYPVELPGGLGNEAAGLVEAVGVGVANFAAGDRVGYFSGPVGAYATHRLVRADLLVKLPDGISSERSSTTTTSPKFLVTF